MFRRVWGMSLVLVAAVLVYLSFCARGGAEGELSGSQLGVGACALIALAALVCEYFDSSLGMGYGTTLTPLLMIVGFSPLEIVPAVLMSEMITGITAGLSHQKVGNVSFARGSRALKVMLALALCSIVGTVAAVLIAVSMPKDLLKTAIGVLILTIGIFLLVNRKRELPFAWRRIVALGSVAAFNKGLSGGGYGPLVTGGQVMAGVDEKSAVAITSLAEGLTCAVGLTVVFLTRGFIAWPLAAALCAGALVSVPFATITVKLMPPQTLRGSIGYVTLFLGILALGKTILP